VVISNETSKGRMLVFGLKERINLWKIIFKINLWKIIFNLWKILFPLQLAPRNAPSCPPTHLPTPVALPQVAAWDRAFWTRRVPFSIAFHWRTFLLPVPPIGTPDP